MPLLDHFRFSRLGRGAAPLPVPVPVPVPESLPVTRLDRMVARQKGELPQSDRDRALDALEEEYSAPLYDSSVYGSGVPGPEED